MGTQGVCVIDPSWGVYMFTLCARISFGPQPYELEMEVEGFRGSTWTGPEGEGVTW